MYLKSSIQTSAIDYNIHITLNILSNIPIQYKKKYNNKYRTPIHQNNLGTLSRRCKVKTSVKESVGTISTGWWNN